MNESTFQWMSQEAGHVKWLDSIMIFLANDVIWILLGLIVLLWLTGRETNQRVVFYACLSCLMALLLAGLMISPLVNHPRPFMVHAFQPLIPHAADASFPSDHATFAFSIAFAVWFVKRKWGSVLIGLAVLTGVARVYVGVHYPADIVGGAALAFVCCYIVRLLSPKLDPAPDFFIRLYRRMTSKIHFLPHSK